MSDFDDFDDLDAVRDFRSAVGLMTPEVDDRIRRRIIDLAIARGIADGARVDDDTDHHDGRTEPTIVLDLPVEGNVPPVPSPSAGMGSSDGSAASVVELHPAARPPARQPRVLVAAAAIFVLLVLAGAVVASRRSRDDIDVAKGPITNVPALLARIGQQPPARTLTQVEFLETVDRVSQTGDQTGQAGTSSYLRTYERGPSGAREPKADDGLFAPKGSTTSSSIPVSPPGIVADRPFDGLTYDEVLALEPTSAEDIRAQMARGERLADDASFEVIRDELDLLRIDITPVPARVQLVRSMSTGAYRETSHRSTADGFELVIANQAGVSVRITFDADTGVLKSWARLDGGAPVEQLEVKTSRTVS